MLAFYYEEICLLTRNLLPKLRSAVFQRSMIQRLFPRVSFLAEEGGGAGTEYNVLNKVVVMARLRRLSNSVFELGRQLEVDFLHHGAVVWLKLSGKTVTNFLVSRHVKRQKASLPVDVRA